MYFYRRYKPLGGFEMKTLTVMFTCTLVLTACGSTDNGLFLNNGNDTSFLRDGANSCPGVIASNNPIYERYPLRCGPQAQVIPR